MARRSKQVILHLRQWLDVDAKGMKSETLFTQRSTSASLLSNREVPRARERKVKVQPDRSTLRTRVTFANCAGRNGRWACGYFNPHITMFGL